MYFIILNNNIVVVMIAQCDIIVFSYIICYYNNILYIQCLKHVLNANSMTVQYINLWICRIYIIEIKN